METQEKKVKKLSNDDLILKFNNERLVWKAKIETITKKLQDLNSIPEVEVEVFSQRQIALEYSHFLMTQLSKINSALRKMKKERFLFYTKNYDLKLDKNPKEMFINVDLEKTVLKKEILDNHLSYIRGTLDTLDKIIYGIKWRLTFEGFKREHIK
jgi:hypothetical protein